MSTYHNTATQNADRLSQHIQGKNVLITGVSQGSLGKTAAEAIVAHHPGLLVLAGRSQKKLAETEMALKAIAPNANIKQLVLDLDSLEAVREAASQVADPIDVLFNNAALITENYEETKDGFERGFGANYLGHFLFTALIFKKLMESSSPRIINISSAAHAASDIHYDSLDFNKGKTFSSRIAYAQTKTAVTLFSVALADRYGPQGITSFSLHPGVIATPGATQLIEYNKDAFVGRLLTADGQYDHSKFKTLAEGAATHIIAGFDPSITKDNGGYLVDSVLANDQAAPYALDKQNAARLWAVSEALVGQKFP